MADDTDVVTAEALLAHERLVRAVARDLLRDEHAVQDVVQDTWLRALRAGPRVLVALPRWLGRVAANRARDLRRAAARRLRHERLGAASDGIDPVDPAESVDTSARRLSVQRDVIAAILALHEPYRTVVLLRYQHGLAPTAIAARTGAKPATVRTQLVRAHELLRERLDGVYGRRDAWGAVLMPWCLGRAGSSAIGVAAWLAAAAAVAFVGVRLFGSGTQSTTATHATSVAGESARTAPDEPRLVGTADAAPRLAAADPRELRVMTAAGAPAANLPVWFWENASRPLWTQPAKLVDEQAVDTRLAMGDIAPSPRDAGPPAMRTDDAGLVLLPTPLPTAITLQMADCIWFTAELPATSPLVLPELASFRARVVGLPEGTSWDVDVGGSPGGSSIVGDYRVNVQTASGPGVVFAGLLERTGLGAEEFATELLAMHPATLRVVGHGVMIDQEESWRPRPVPALVQLRAVRRIPAITVRVFERDGSPTKRRGGVWIHGEPPDDNDEGWLADGAIVFDRKDVGPRPTIQVRMPDGESVRREADFSSAGLQRSIDLRLDDAIPPLRVHVPDLTKQRLANVVVQYGGNNSMNLIPPNEAITEMQIYKRRMAGLHEGALWIAECGPRWETPTSLVVWERLAIANEQGALALTPRPVVHVDELWGTWEPMAPPRDLDVGAYAGRLASPPAYAQLMFELPAIPSPRRTWGTGTESRWHVVRSVTWHRHEIPRQPAPVWRGLTLASTVKWRLCFGDAEGQELGVFDLAP